MSSVSTNRPVRRFASIAAAAEYAAVGTKTVRRWIATGELTGYRAGTRIIRIDLNELDAMLRPMPSATSGGEGA